MIALYTILALGAPPSIDEPPISGASAPHDVAVVIANEYYGNGFSRVTYASRDADAFAAWLARTRGVPQVNITRLAGATRKGITSTVEKAAGNVGPGGTLWVY